MFLALFLIGFTGMAQNDDVLTPEKLWQLKRVGSPAVSPDAQAMVYGVSEYSVKENNGTRALYVLAENAESPRRVTPQDGYAYNATWRPDGKKIAYLSATDDGFQIFEMNANGSEKKQNKQHNRVVFPVLNTARI